MRLPSDHSHSLTLQALSLPFSPFHALLPPAVQKVLPGKKDLGVHTLNLFRFQREFREIPGYYIIKGTVSRKISWGLFYE